MKKKLKKKLKKNFEEKNLKIKNFEEKKNKEKKFKKRIGQKIWSLFRYRHTDRTFLLYIDYIKTV